MRFRPLLMGLKVNRHELAQLRQELLNSGYSVAYVRRLVGELRDHLACVEEENGASASADETETRIGSRAAIVQAVGSFDELTPVPNRYPFAIFAFLPALLLLTGNLGWLSCSNLLSQTRPFEADAMNQGLAWFIEWGNFLFPVIVSVTASWVAFRCRSHWDLPLLAAAVMGISNSFSLNAIVCEESHLLVCHQAWEFDGFQMLLVLAPPCLCALCLLQSSLCRSSQHRIDLDGETSESMLEIGNDS